MAHRIEVGVKPDFRDAAGMSVKKRIADDLGISVEDVRVIDVYTIDAELAPDELELVRRELFTDAILQESSINASIARDFDFIIEVGFRPGVTDNVGKSAAEGMADTLGRRLRDGENVYTSKQYVIRGKVSKTECERIARDLLANDLIQRWAVKSYAEMQSLSGKSLLGLPIVKERSETTVYRINLDVEDQELLQLSRERMWALDLNEMKTIQAYYRRSDVQELRKQTRIGSLPTDVEIEILAQTWSEHCKHKIFNAMIEYVDAHGKKREIHSLFKTYIKRTTEEVSKSVDWLVSVFHDNAGIVRFTDDWNFAFKCETHNSPSALDPYGGAMTGIVGVNRDILGAGLGCKCIFNTDVFCFASPFYDGEIPPRLLHPKRVLRGVHQGVKDGGNQSGIPDVNGAIVFHERFLGKPLVFCGTGGLIPRLIAGRASHEKRARPGDYIVMAGGRIGKDGIHGATFSSEELHEGSPVTAVQIGDPITQKKMADFILEARDEGLFTAITDNGAGGLSSSVGEMARGSGGAEVHLEKAPLKYPGLAPWEIFLSEAQERMTLAVPPEHESRLRELARKHDVEITVLGKFNDSGLLTCFYEGKPVATLHMDFLHEGLPTMRLRAVWDPPPVKHKPIPESKDLITDLKRVLGSLNVCSKESFVRMYDHEVQGQSVLKQFQGASDDGPGDAGVIRPLLDSKRGIAVACGICPKYSDIDTYAMMACAIDEAVRNLVSVGVPLGRIAGLDNFCWPDPVASDKNPDGEFKLAQLVRCCEALYDTCIAYGIPLISGKDSMKNDYRIGNTKISIPPTVLFSAVGFLDDVSRVVSMDFKRPGDVIYLLGRTANEMGGSEYMSLYGVSDGVAPVVDVALTKPLYMRLHEAIDARLVASCHDCSDGGLGVAISESAFAGGFGFRIDLNSVPAENDTILMFSESAGRFIVTVAPDHAAAFESLFSGLPVFRMGNVTHDTQAHFVGRNGWEGKIEIAELKQAWQQPLNW